MKTKINRRNFMKGIGGAGLSAVLLPVYSPNINAIINDDIPKTNIQDALKYPRTAESMPGLFPGKVIQTVHEKSIANNIIDQELVDEMIENSMLELTGEKTIQSAWLKFVKPSDRIGIKVNPIGGALLSTSLEVTRSIIDQLRSAGVPNTNIIIWDRRDFELKEAGFTKENFPGIQIIGTEQKDEADSFYDNDGNLYGAKMIDKEWYYWADTEERYDAETLPYMINEGKHSYFSRIATQMVDKIINVPVLKNAGTSVTLCMKNLAYGSISNTGRLHKQLWSETSAEVCAFPPLRDKVVLNIVDGIKGCYQGGPGADPKFIIPFYTILAGTDPVAVDRIGYDIVYKTRVQQGVQKEESVKGKKFMEFASALQLGESDISKIDLRKINLS